MGDNVVVKTFQNLASYFIIVLGGTWVVEAILGPSREIAGFSAFQVCLIQGSYFRGLLILLCLYVVYFVAAAVVSQEGGSGKFILVVIGCFLVLSLAGDVFELIHDSHDTLVNVTISFGVLIVSLEDILQIIATIHGLKS